MKEPDIDPAFDRGDDFEILARGEDAVQVSEAMQRFLDKAEVSEFHRAVATYVRAAQQRGEPIEQVLASLRAVADTREPRDLHALDHDSSKLHEAVLEGVLLAFYGKSVVREQQESRNDRRERRRPKKDVR